ncbi:MAG: metal-dependent transcriptional regulator [Dialister sp.]|nr:metal-dependent transcriptional regulator [Dialister sp.]
MGCDEVNSSRQDYLETIYRLSAEKGYTINKKIADFLGVSKPSVTEMIGKLQGEGLVSMEGAHISLTNTGEEQAKRLLSDHRLWEYFLCSVLGMRRDRVHEQADLLEHVTGDELRLALNRFLNYPTASPTGKKIYDNLPHRSAKASED